MAIHCAHIGRGNYNWNINCSNVVYGGWDVKNKQVKQMLYSIYCDLHCKYAEDSIGIEKYTWAFDRLRLCEMGFERNKLRYSEFSKISLTANQLKGIK